ncbi:sensor histidine kinase [Streptomyces cacaoi]|uniref:sensor histidine kinase n=1 Tax=Streptomyces cacaoi TaxID=1898 RepID=UPI0011F39053|nr:histidine kinase [Streptomyces cacaoi]
MTETGENRARGAPWWWGRPRSVVLDVFLGVASAAECGLQGESFARETGLPTALTVLLGLLVGALLVLRRRWPIAVVLVAIAVIPAEMGTLMSIVGLYTLAATEVPRRITGLLASMAALGTLVMVMVRLGQGIGQDPDFNPSAWFVPLMSVLWSVGMTAPPVLLGLYVGARRRLVESLRERADGLERELSLLADRAEERAEWARNEERTRIAREMHDVVAHRVSLMVVHAAALQAVALKDPEKASKNAALVGDMGRQALEELRTMLGVLRAGDAGKSAVGERSGAAGALPVAAGAGAGAEAGERGAGSGAAGQRVPGARRGTSAGADGADGADGGAGETGGTSGTGGGAVPGGPPAVGAVRPDGVDVDVEAVAAGGVNGVDGAGRGEGAAVGAGVAEPGRDGVVGPRGAPAGSGGGTVSASGAGVGSASGVAGAGRSSSAAVGGAGSGVAEAVAGVGAPRLAELDVLVGQSRAAGMTVELSVEGEPVRECPEPVEQTAYRVVQEALTNVHKHAAGAATRVRVAHRAAEVALQVENEPAVDGAVEAGLPSGGNGLVGMRERVTALGGGFVSGPTDAGGFRVSAIIPYARS